MREYYETKRSKVGHDIQVLKRSFLELMSEQTASTSREWEQLAIQTPIKLYKVVSCWDGKLFSIWDGQTSYELGRWHQSKCGATAFPPLWSCYFAFESHNEAVMARFPPTSKLLNAPRVVIEIEAMGKAYKRGDTWAVSHFKMVAIRDQDGQ